MSERKTAGEWDLLYKQICFNDPAVSGQLLPTPQNIKFIQHIITSERNAALDEAAELIDPESETNDCSACRRHLKDVQQAIIALKDKL